MKEFTYVLTDPAGIHARPAGILVTQTKGYKSDVKVLKGDKEANAKSMLSLMGLGAKSGEELVIQADGEDEDEVIVELEEFFKENL